MIVRLCTGAAVITFTSFSQGGVLVATPSPPHAKTVPFVFISSSMLDDIDRRRALAAGADRFLVRPIDNAQLLAEIEDCLAMNKAA